MSEHTEKILCPDCNTPVKVPPGKTVANSHKCTAKPHATTTHTETHTGGSATTGNTATTYTPTVTKGKRA